MEDKYKSMTVPQLAGEESFIRWVTKGENHQYWSGLQQNPEQAETISQATQVVQSLVSLSAHQIPQADKKELWNKINTSIQKNPQTVSTKSYSIIRWSIAIAASLALLVWFNSFRGIERVIAGNAETKEISLPESSQVIVNADSRLVYNKNKFNDDRELKLDGEAFFKVKPGSHFTVKTDQGTVTVLGTSFNVISRPGIFEVSCHTGKVLVTNNANEKLFQENPFVALLLPVQRNDPRAGHH